MQATVQGMGTGAHDAISRVLGCMTTRYEGMRLKKEDNEIFRIGSRHVKVAFLHKGGIPAL